MVVMLRVSVAKSLLLCVCYVSAAAAQRDGTTTPNMNSQHQLHFRDVGDNDMNLGN